MIPFSEKSFYIKTFGCQMNVADTERMSVILSDLGAKPAEDPMNADIVILNGCEIREKAVHKALSKLGQFKKSKKWGHIIGVGGCVGQLEGDALFKRNPHLDFVFGTDTIDHLPEIIHQVQNGSRHVVFNEFDKTRDYSTETKIFNKSHTAFINIMKGCDKFCSYCIVPFTRGREKSRAMDEIVSDVKRLTLLGVTEITLLGQNVNSYGKGNKKEENFPMLLRALDGIKGLKRLRFTSSHPIDFSDELIDCYHPETGVKALCRHLHLPVQSGSNAVLDKMFRHYKIELFYEQIKKWRAICPDGGLSTDIILGFPTETEEDFQLTMKLLEDMRFDLVYAFAYSTRPGTKAAKLADDVPEEVKHDRLLRFQKRAVEISSENNQLLLGKTMEVLVEEKVQPHRNSPHKDVYAARTSCNRVVNFAYSGTRNLIGKYVNVTIERASGLALTSVLEHGELQ